MKFFICLYIFYFFKKKLKTARQRRHYIASGYNFYVWRAILDSYTWEIHLKSYLIERRSHPSVFWDLKDYICITDFIRCFRTYQIINFYALWSVIVFVLSHFYIQLFKKFWKNIRNNKKNSQLFSNKISTKSTCNPVVLERRNNMAILQK